MNPTLGLVIDILLFCALCGTAFYSFRLSRQFAKLQADRKAFEQLIQALNVASARAEAAVRSIKEAAQGSGEHLQEKITTARGLSAELEIMVQAGDNLAERLSSLAEKGRKAHAATDSTAPAETIETAPRTRAEKELLEAVKAKQKS
jgi:hypothetical protein